MSIASFWDWSDSVALFEIFVEIEGGVCDLSEREERCYVS